MQDKKNDDTEKILTVNGEEVTDEMREEREQQLLAKKAELENLLKNGEIDGVEYNRRIIDLEVNDEYKAQQRMPRKKKRLLIVLFVILLIIVATPGAIYMNFRFYFQNTLKSEGIVLEQNEKLEELEEPEEVGQPGESSLENGPVQVMTVKNDSVREKGTYKGRNITLTYKYYYDITGVVTSVHDYWGFDDYSALIPRDVCLTWGSLAETFLDGGATFHQTYENCYGKVTDTNAEPAETFTFKTSLGQTRSSLALMSNNHLVASTAEIRNQILNLKVKDKIRIKGYLIDAAYGDISLRSSVWLEDVGENNSEIIYVTKIENFGQENNK